MTHLAAVGFMPRTAAYSSKPVAATGTYHIAVGGSKGHIKVSQSPRAPVCKRSACPYIDG